MDLYYSITAFFESDNYSVLNLMTMFFFFALAGWIWESSYESVRNKKLTNRGMLIGPYIPIYGFGGLFVYVIFSEMQDASIAKIFIYGMIAATLLEFITSFVLDKLFHVSFWSYEGYFGNIQGRICFWASLFWGILSVVFTKFVNPYISEKIFGLDHDLRLIIVTVLTTTFIIDLVSTVTSAIKFKQRLADIKIMESLKIDEFKEKVEAIVGNRDDYKKILARFKNKPYQTNNIIIKHFINSYKNMKFSSKESQNVFNKFKEYYKNKKEK